MVMSWSAGPLSTLGSAWSIFPRYFFARCDDHVDRETEQYLDSSSRARLWVVNTPDEYSAPFYVDPAALFAHASIFNR